MNLHGIVSGAINAVNPAVLATIQISTGYTTAADGTRTAAFATVLGTAQVQPLTYSDLQQIDGMDITGTRRSIYFNGAFDGANRVTQKGGDLVTLTSGPNAGTWLTVQVAETWPDWCKLICTLQKAS